MILGKQGGDTAVLLSQTPDGLNVNIMTQEDLTMTLDDFQRVSWTLRAVDEKSEDLVGRYQCITHRQQNIVLLSLSET